MKIEKGKLYCDKATGSVNIASFDIVNIPGITDKIAVHCPTKEDWDYVRKEYLLEFWVYSKRRGYCALNDDFIRYDERGCEDNGYNIITIDQFKEFYPDVENWEEKAKQEALKSVEELASNGVKESLSTLGDKLGLIGNINPSHYSTLSIQPIDYIEANKLDFNEGNVIKYVSRYKQKNGLEDLKKARFYIDRLIEINSK